MPSYLHVPKIEDLPFAKIKKMMKFELALCLYIYKTRFYLSQCIATWIEGK